VFTNVGTGRGYSVLQIVCEFERISGRAVSRRIVERRPGDMAVCYADPGLARSALGWSVSLSLEECRDAWNRRQSSGRG